MSGRVQVVQFPIKSRACYAGTFAVLAVLLKANSASRANPALQFALDQAHSRDAEAPALIQSPKNIHMMSLIPPSSPGSAAGGSLDAHAPVQLLHYTGSLTTPPCSAQVCWYVFMAAVAVADSQVQTFKQFIKQTTGLMSNARPLQPLDGRPLEWLQCTLSQ